MENNDRVREEEKWGLGPRPDRLHGWSCVLSGVRGTDQ